MSIDEPRRRGQFSLRTFLLAILVVGPVAGVVIPIILESITEWKPPASPQPRARQIRSSTLTNDSESHYETGETPLY